jgi:two-component system NtrC family sensor kinase
MASHRLDAGRIGGTVAVALSQLQLSDVTRLGTAVRALGMPPPSSVEAFADRLVRFLYDELREDDGARRSAVLIRMYMTTEYGDLDDELRQFGARVAGGTVAGTTRCLTLMATAGEQAAWNDRHQSAGHKTIPLPSEDVVQSIPMVAQLLTQLGISVAAVVAPDPKLVLELEQHAYNVFYVADAHGSPYIPAQTEFVEPFGVQSVLGFGGLLPTGDVFAILLFTRVPVPRPVADTFRNLALNTKVALLSCAGAPMFEPTPESGHA